MFRRVVSDRETNYLTSRPQSRNHPSLVARLGHLHLPLPRRSPAHVYSFPTYESIFENRLNGGRLDSIPTRSFAPAKSVHKDEYFSVFLARSLCVILNILLLFLHYCPWVFVSLYYPLGNTLGQIYCIYVYMHFRLHHRVSTDILTGSNVSLVKQDWTFSVCKAIRRIDAVHRFYNITTVHWR